MKRYIIISFLFILLIHTQTSLCQNPFIRNYTFANGLPTNRIYCVAQDNNGFMWFGSDAGAIRYDGSDFVQFTEEDGLSDRMIMRIKQDKEGRIWFLNYNGTVNYFYKNKFFNGNNAPFLNEIKTDFFFHDFFQAKDSTLYFYNSNSEIYVVKNNEFIDYSNLIISHKQNIKNTFYLNQTNENIFQVWTTAGVYSLCNLNDTATKENLETSLSRVVKKSNTETFVIDNQGFLNYYTDTHLTKGKIFDIQSILVNDVITDNEGLVWISSFDRGIFCLKDDEVILHMDIKFPQNLVLDKDQNIWTVSTSKGIYKINRNILKYKFLKKENFDNEGIKCITSSNQHKVWATNGNKVFQFRKNTIYKSAPLFKGEIINKLIFLKDNTLLAYGSGTPIYMFTQIKLNPSKLQLEYDHTNTSTFLVKTVAIDTSENLLYTHLGDKIIESNLKTDIGYTRSPKQGRIKNLIINNKNQLVINAATNKVLEGTKILSNTIYENFNGDYFTAHLTIDNENELYATQNKEIFILTKDSIYSIFNDLKSQIDFKIKDMEYHDSTLFFCTQKTLYFVPNPLKRIDGKAIELNRLNIDFNNINDIFCHKNSLFVGSEDGMTIIPVKECVHAENHHTKPYFSKILLDEEEIDISDGIIRYKNKNRLSIEFSSLNFSSNPSSYSYMLEGVNTSWITGNEKQVVYLNLAPGQYTFKLKSRKNQEEYSEAIELPIIVVPTFFQRLITKIILALIILCIAFLIIRIYYQKQIKSREKDNLLVTLENRALQSMMNPHFIFNSLGSIQKYLLQNKAEEAGNYLSQFARLIRQTMNSIKSNYVLLDDEIDRLRNYIELEQLRMEGHFSYSIQMDDKLEDDDYTIPSMIIQPFVENAIWHGISPLPKKGMITIRFQYTSESCIRIIIEDNGIGFEKSKAFSHSKNNLNMASALTKKRIRLIGEKYKVKTEVIEEELTPGEENPGSRISLLLPIVD